MPLGQFKDFDDCVRKTSRRKGFSSDGARRYCGAIKRDVEGSRDDRHTWLVVEAEPGHLTLGDSPQTAGQVPWYSVHYEYLSEDLLKLGFRVSDYEEADGKDYPISWVMPIRKGATYERTSAEGITDGYQDTIGPISVKVVNSDVGPGFYGFDDDDDDDDDDRGPRSPGPEPTRPSRSLSPQPLAAEAAIGPDDWSYDFGTLLSALEFKRDLEASGPTGAQIANKLVFRKKRLRYVAYQLPQHELTYLKRFVGQDRGPWQKQEPHDEVL